MFHSTPISEPVAQICGLIVGLLSYAICGTFTTDHHTRVLVGQVSSVLTNLVIGAKINVFTLDLLALLVVRPLSAVAGAGLLSLVANVLGS
jgi:hypothetical protein